MNMETEKKGSRILKQRIFNILKSENPGSALEQLDKIPAFKVINPLFSFLYHLDRKIKWTAVTAMGVMVKKIADVDMEAARVIIRRLMWNLNDESGGIGWGSPEAMGEILACHEALALEYSRVLLSYARKDGNYLEDEKLQRGLLWGIGRLARVKPDLIQNSIHHLTPYLKSEDATVRGLAVWIMGLINTEEAHSNLENLTEDCSELQIYTDQQFMRFKIKELALKALRRNTGISQ